MGSENQAQKRYGKKKRVRVGIGVKIFLKKRDGKKKVLRRGSKISIFSHEKKLKKRSFFIENRTI